MIASTASLAVLMLITGPPAAGSPTGTDPAGTASVTIMVDDAGTKVHNKGTTWVSVTPNGAGKTAVVAPGAKQDFTSASDVQSAAQASAGSKALTAPSLLSPSDKEKVKLKPTDKGPGQATLTWTPVAGAREYEVEFTVDNGRAILLKATRAEAKLPPNIQSGKVAWAVRSVGEGTASEQSSRRWFELQQEDIKLDVRPPTGWK